MTAARTRIDEGCLTGSQTKIGTGALGTVYRLESYSDDAIPGPIAYKIFHQHLTDSKTISAIDDLIRFRLALSESNRAVLDRSFAWPLKLVVNRAGGCVGLLMPLAAPQYLISPVVNGELQDERIANLDLLFAQNPDLSSVPLPDPDDVVTRLRICLSLTEAVVVLHSGGFVYGDFSQRNGMYTLTPSPNILLIDCDEIRRESDSFRKQANTPLWFPPEGAGALQTRSTDMYKVSLFILRCLVPGGPDGANKVKPELATHVLDAIGMDLLERSLGADPVRRPTATDWSRYLAGQLAQLTSPPTIASLSISDDIFPIGEPVSIRWHVVGAKGPLFLQWPDGYVETFSAETDPAGSVRPATGMGFVTLIAQNDFGEVRRSTPMIRIFKLPVLEKLSVPGLQSGNFRFPVPPDLGRQVAPPDQQLIGLFTGSGPVQLPDFYRLTGEPADLRTVPFFDAPVVPTYAGEHPIPPMIASLQAMEMFRLMALPSLNLMVPDLPRTGLTRRPGRFRTLLQRLRADELTTQPTSAAAAQTTSTEGFAAQ